MHKPTLSSLLFLPMLSASFYVNAADSIQVIIDNKVYQCTEDASTECTTHANNYKTALENCYKTISGLNKVENCINYEKPGFVASYPDCSYQGTQVCKAFCTTNYSKNKVYEKCNSFCQ